MTQSLLGEILTINKATRVSNLDTRENYQLHCSAGTMNVDVEFTSESSFLVHITKPSFDRAPDSNLVSMEVKQTTDDHYFVDFQTHLIDEETISTQLPEATLNYLENYELFIESKKILIDFVKWVHTPVNRRILSQEMKDRVDSQLNQEAKELEIEPEAFKALEKQYGSTTTRLAANKIVQYIKEESKRLRLPLSIRFITRKPEYRLKEQVMKFDYSSGTLALTVHNHKISIWEACALLANGWLTTDIEYPELTT